MTTLTSQPLNDRISIPDPDVCARLLRPPIGFNHPSDILKDPFLDPLRSGPSSRLGPRTRTPFPHDRHFGNPPPPTMPFLCRRSCSPCGGSTA